MPLLTIEVPDQIDQQLKINGLTHHDLTKLFFYWVEIHLSDPETSSLFLSEKNLESPPIQQNKKVSLSSIIGRGKGSFSTPEEADAFIRAERDA